MEFNQKMIFCPRIKNIIYDIVCICREVEEGFNPKNNIFQWRSDPKMIMNIAEGILVTMIIDN